MKSFPRSVVSAVLAAALCSSVAVAGKIDIPLPPEVIAARDLLVMVERSKTLPDEAKQLVRENHAAVQTQFDGLWKPLVSLVDERVTAHATISAELKEIEKQILLHNERLKDVPRTDFQAVESHNRRSEALNRQGKEATERGQRTLAQYDAQIKSGTAGVQTWLTGPSRTSYSAVTDGLLSGRIVFRTGSTWNDLVDAARAAGLYKEPPAPK
jgi:hypothetical protein